MWGGTLLISAKSPWSTVMTRRIPSETLGWHHSISGATLFFFYLRHFLITTDLGNMAASWSRRVSWFSFGRSIVPKAHDAARLPPIAQSADETFYHFSTRAV